jgi:WD40 repeat protein
MWSAEPDSLEPLIETHQMFGAVGISPNGKWLVTSASGRSDGSAAFPAAKVWDLPSRAPGKFYLAYKNRQPVELAFSPQGNLFALGDVEKEGVTGLWNTAAWDTASGRVEPFRYLTNGFEAGSLRFSPDGKILAAAGLEFVSDDPSHATNRLAFWEVRSWQRLDLLPGTGAGTNEWAAAATVDFSNDGRLLAIGYRDGWVRLWDLKQQRLVMQSKAHHNFGFGGAVVRFSGDNRWLVSIMKARQGMALFDLTDPKRTDAVLSRSDPGTIWWATFAPDNKSLVTGENELVKFWNLQTLRVALTLPQGHGPGAQLVFGPDGDLLAGREGTGVVRFWTAPSLERIDQRRKRQ